MIGFNRRERVESFCIGLLSLGALVGIISPVKAQYPPNCYLINQAGQLIDLSSICGVEETATSSQNNLPNNRVTGQQTSLNQQQAPYGQQLGAYGQQGQPIPYGQPTGAYGYSQQLPFQQQQNYFGQGANSVTTGFGRTAQGTTTFYDQWQSVVDSAPIRSEPSGGSLVQQVQGGEPVRVYPGSQTNNFVFVETANGRRGWINTWYLPGSSGVSP